MEDVVRVPVWCGESGWVEGRREGGRRRRRKEGDSHKTVSLIPKLLCGLGMRLYHPVQVVEPVTQ